MQVLTTATVLPLLGLLRPTAEPRLQPILHPHGRRRRRGCTLMRPVNGKARDAVTCEPFDGDRRDKDAQREMPQMIDAIRAMLRSMGDGEISVSAYDTAWVALVKNLDGNDGPQFPSTIDWIVQNQLSDGSWGDTFFLVYDRIINTLACVVALKSWNIHADKCEKGLSFIRENLWRLAEAEDDWMLVGFELTFPSLLEMANDLGLDMPCDEPPLQAVYAKRDLKLTKIPKDVLHTIPTTLLHSIEGMQQGLDWEKLLKLQCSDGSFMSSSAPTAYALMQTGDGKCLEFLDGIVKKFNGAVPCTYPVEIFERLWAADRLERLGISRYFTSEIEEFLDYVYRHWTQEGLPATRDSCLNDIDDTAMGFRLLRVHGYHVSPCVFKNFEKDSEFCCYPAQSNQSVTAMYNLYRAAQVAFPGEDELERAKIYCRAFLHDRRASNKLNDKWVIAKDLPGEIGYALDFPWNASLPRIETRMYLEQYGASGDAWIAKVLFRMPLISNDLYLQAAKADFSDFQTLCQIEWRGLKMWYGKNNLEMYGVTPQAALRAYFLAAANIFEPNRATERLGWACTAVLAEAVSSHFRSKACTDNMKEVLIRKLTSDEYDNLARRSAQDATGPGLLCATHELIHLLASEATMVDGLREAWKQWLMAWSSEEGRGSCGGNTALLLVRTVEICSGRNSSSSEQKLGLSEYSQLEQLTCSICRKLAAGVLARQGGGNTDFFENLDGQVDLEMQELTQRVLQSCDAVDRVTRQTFLHVVKSFYYVAHCSPEAIDSHISMVIFENVI